MRKATNFEQHLKRELRNPQFRRLYEEEGRRLEVAYKILQIRKKQKLTQGDLAKRIGSTQSAVARLEKGEQNFSVDLLQKIAFAFRRNLRIDFVK